MAQQFRVSNFKSVSVIAQGQNSDHCPHNFKFVRHASCSAANDSPNAVDSPSKCSIVANDSPNAVQRGSIGLEPAVAGSTSDYGLNATAPSGQLKPSAISLVRLKYGTDAEST